MINSSAHWRQCANKCRHLADQSRDPPIKNTILDIALLYERAPVAEEPSTRCGVARPGTRLATGVHMTP